MALKAVCCLVLAGGLAACALLPQKQSGDDKEAKLTEAERRKLAEYQAEVTVGRDMAGRLLQFYGTYGNPDLVNYVNQVGLYVAANSEYPERRYMFSILDTEAVNAFACPGGYILVTLGSIRRAKSEAELAMILGHEIAHVGKKHMFNTLQNLGQKELEKDKKDQAEALENSLPQENQARERPVAQHSDSVALLTRYLSQSTGGAAMTLLQAAKAGMNVLLEKGLDAEYEFEADSAGTSYAISAGYDPKGLLRFLSRLEKDKAKQQVDTAIMEKTHPKLSERKKRIRKLLADIDAKKIVGAKGVSRYRKMLRSLPKT